jgi:hypothetical protein
LKESLQLNWPMHVREKTKGIFVFPREMMEGGGRIKLHLMIECKECCCTWCYSS